MITRSYNPISADSDNYVTLLVKRYGDKAQMGSALHNLKAGESVEVKCPNRQWKLPEKGSVQIYYMIAGGTGITPIHQATEGILQHDENARVVLLTLNKTEDDVLLKDELVALQKKSGDRLKVVHLTNYTCCSVKDAVSTVLPQASSWAAAKVPVKVMVCGRANMTAAICGPKTKDYKQGEVDGVLKEFGYTKDQVWKF
jgi:cytochrome-b5 reductase